MSEIRKNQFCLKLNDQELELIHKKMEQCGFRNMSAYLRKIAIDGMIIHVDLKEVKEMVRLTGRIGANINQIAIRCNETNHIYKEDLNELKEGYQELSTQVKLAASEVATLRRVC